MEPKQPRIPGTPSSADAATGTLTGAASRSEVTTCAIHGLKYSPALVSGCVLCRQASADEAAIPRFISPHWVALPLVGLVALGAWRIAKDPPGTLRITTSAAIDWGTSSPYAECSSECAATHGECDQRCSGRADAADCAQYCLSEADRCFGECKKRFQKADPPWSFYYGAGEMPDWSLVLLESVPLSSRLLECAEEPVKTLAFVRVPGDAGAAKSVQVWKKGMSDAAHTCVVRALSEASFPRSNHGDYAFMAGFDARYDRLRLGIARVEAEIAAASRKRPEVETETLKSRLFDAKVVLSKELRTPLDEQEAKLSAASKELEASKRELSGARSLAQRLTTTPRSAPPPPPPPPPPVVRPPKTDGQGDKKRVEELQKENQRELEHYRSVNRQYREEERRMRALRAWERTFDP